MVAQALTLNELTVKIEEEEGEVKNAPAINVAEAAGYSLGCLLSGFLGDAHPNSSFYLGSSVVILIFFLTFYLPKRAKPSPSLQEDNPAKTLDFAKKSCSFYFSFFFVLPQSTDYLISYLFLEKYGSNHCSHWLGHCYFPNLAQYFSSP